MSNDIAITTDMPVQIGDTITIVGPDKWLCRPRAAILHGDDRRQRDRVVFGGKNIVPTSVTFSGSVLAVVVTVLGCNSITVVVPDGAVTGPVEVVVDGSTYTTTEDCQIGTLSAPEVDSYDPDSGQIGDFVTIMGLRFTGATDVSFNGMSASFDVLDDASILATVPSGATTGTVSVTTPDGTGVGPSFTVLANPFAFDLTGTLPSGIIGTRSGGGTFYLARSAGTAAAAETGSDVYEDRETERGQWTFPAYQNRVATPTDLSGWTNNVATLTTSQTDPTGGTNATKVDDEDGAVVASIYSPDPSHDGYDPMSSVWVKDDVGSPPNGSGILAVTDGTLFPKAFCSGITPSLGSGTTWRRRYSKAYTSGVAGPPRVLVSPSGQTPTTPPAFATQDGTKTGARHFFMPMAFEGPSTDRPPFDAPTIDGATSKRVLKVDDPKLADVMDGNGDFDVEGSLFLPDIVGSQTNAETDIVTISVGGVITKLYVDQGIAWHSIFKDSSPDGQSITLGRRGQLLYWRLWYKPSEGSYGWAVRFNGAVVWVQANGSPGAALGTPTAMYLGCDESEGNVLPAMHTLLRRSARSITTLYDAEGVILGDSTMAPYLGVYVLVASLIYSSTEAAQRLGILSLAVTAQTAVQQLAVWQASPARGNSAVKWVGVRVGINDIGGGANSSTLKTRIQNIIDDVNTNNPTAKVVLIPMVPWGHNFDAGQTTTQQTVNAWLAGGGGGFTGSNLLFMPVWTALDDGSGGLLSQYQTGDGHNNDDARIGIEGPAIRQFLIDNGLL